MRKRLHEIMDMPTEFHEDGAPEFPVLPDEFNRNAPNAVPDEVKNRPRKIMLYFAAMGLFSVGLLFSSSPHTKDPTASVTPPPAAQASETPALTARPTAAVTMEPTAEPTQAPAATPDPVPEVDVIYYYRASLVYYAALNISVPDRVTSVSLRLTAPNDEKPALEIELTPEEIAGGYYRLRVGDRDDGFDANAYFAYHEEADLTMELRYTVSGDAGEKTHVETFASSEELWIDWRYDSEEDIGGIAEWMYGEIFPNCFVVRLYESTDPEQQLIVGSDAGTLKNGGIAIAISIDGRDIPSEDGTLYSAMYRYTDDDTAFYDYALVIPVPEDFPQHGTATMTLTRRLTDSDAVIVRSKTIEY